MAPKVYMIFIHTVWDSVFPEGGVRVFLGWLEFVLVCIIPRLMLNLKLTMRSERAINVWFIATERLWH